MANSISSYLSPYIVGNAIEALGETMALVAATNKDVSTAAGVKGQTITMGVPQALTATAVTAANTAPAPSAITVGYRSVALSNEYKTSFAMSGKEVQDYAIDKVFVEQLKEAVRGMAYKVNSTLWSLYTQIPYATGNSGTGLFATNANTLSDMDALLTKNLCPVEGRKFVCSTKDFAALASLTEINYAMYRGDDRTNKTGQIGDVRGFTVFRDQQIPTHTKGTITGTVSVTGNTAVGVSTVNLTCATGEGVAFKAGDLVEFGDGVSYAIAADVTIGAAATGDIVLDRGLEKALTSSNAIAFATTACTFDANSLVTIGGRMDGISLCARLPETAPMGYSTQGDHMPIIDPVSGFPFLVSIYPQYKQVAVEVSCIYGAAVTDSRRLCRGLTYSS